MTVCTYQCNRCFKVLSLKLECVLVNEKMNKQSDVLISGVVNLGSVPTCCVLSHESRDMLLYRYAKSVGPSLRPVACEL